MSLRVLILGAGPAAAASALALSERDDVEITVLDVGGRLEPDHALARERLSALKVSDWSSGDLASVTELPVHSAAAGALPEKRSYGSDFPFRDFGQRLGIAAADPVNGALVSGAYGGFSNVWGAQLMPFSRRTFDDWPISADAMRPHYEALLREVPLTADEDDLSELFPLLSPSSSLPGLSARTVATLSRYDRGASRLKARGVTLGRARLALRATECVRCGLCMTGCPYSLIYSASQTFDRLRAQGRITYHSGLLASRIEETGEEVTVVAKELGANGWQRFTADRVVVACGAVGSTRLVAGSLGLYDTPVRVAESTQFLLPFLSSRPVVDPRTAQDFTLNQFNMLVDLDGGHDLSQLHFYTYNAAFLEAMPKAFKSPRLELGVRALLRRLSVALGYLPSWASPTFELTLAPGKQPDGLPEMRATSSPPSFLGNAFLRQVLARVVSAAPTLDLWPVLPMLKMSAPGKSYHWGGTFPHSDRQKPFSSDALGRVGPWRRVHMADAAVFPTVPSTTFTLTIMANAHRIASGILEEPS